jgi:hypothetical protein
MGSGSFRSTRSLWLLCPLALAAAAGCGDKAEKVLQMQCGDGYNAETGAVGMFDLQAEANLKVRAFLDTSFKLKTAIKEIEAEGVAACEGLGKDLGMTASDLAVADDEPGAKFKGICNKVAARIQATLEETLTADASLVVQWQPPRCVVDVMAQAMCTQMCENKTVTATEIQCKPGKLSGMCSAQCMGSCSAQCMGTCMGGCTGECNGMCDAEISGTCMGTCQGQCDGMCSVMGADGKCNGTCMGSCSGKCMGRVQAKCSGSCMGSCSASCTGSCTGGCMGSCTGSCSVMFQAPQCEEVQVMKEVTECTQTCDAQARASAKCEPGQVLVEFNSSLQRDAMKKARLETTLTALRKHLPGFFKATLRAKNVVEASASAYFKALASVAAEVKGNLKASACVGLAVNQGGGDGKRLGAAGTSSADLIAALKAKGKAFACMGFDADKGMPGPTFTTAAGIKLNNMLAASVSLTTAANKIQTDTLAACKAMGEKLGLPAGMLAGDVKAVCGAVKTEIDRLIGTLRANVKVRIATTPAVCTVNAMASFRCTEMCEMKTVTQTDIQCTPAKLSGSCSAMCTGSCKGMCTARISGSCTATCMGSCDAQVSATCTGTCMGTCEAMGTTMSVSGMCAGTCHGRCMGTISGSCQGKCEGMCSGTVEASCMGMCMGNCTGGCSVTYQAPYCEEVEVMREVTECQRSCDARAKAEAMCTAPTVNVAIETNAADLRANATKLADALKAGYGTLLKVRKHIEGALQVSIEGFARGLEAVPAAIKESGPMGAGCVAAAISATASASAKIKASLEGSVGIAGSVTAFAATQ